MREYIRQHGLAKLGEYMAEEEAKLRSMPLNIAVIGNSGVGKSTFINTMRGLHPSDIERGAAAVGVVQTTLDPTPYKDPSSPNLVYWDLPGVGTLQYPIGTYKEQISFDRYDCFLILSQSRFTTNDAWLATEAENVRKNCYFTRTKVDIDLASEQEDYPSGFNEEAVLKKIIGNIKANFRLCGLDAPVFLISCKLNHKSRWDFPALRARLLGEFPISKRAAIISAMTATGKEVIALKYELLKKKIPAWAALSGAAGMVPIPGVEVAADISLVVNRIKYYMEQFGIDLPCMERLSTTFSIPLSALLREIETEKGETSPRALALEALGFKKGVRGFLKGLEIAGSTLAKTTLITIGGPAISGSISFTSTYFALNKVLRKLRDAAEKIQDIVWEASTGRRQFTEEADHVHSEDEGEEIATLQPLDTTVYEGQNNEVDSESIVVDEMTRLLGDSDLP